MRSGLPYVFLFIFLFLHSGVMLAQWRAPRLTRLGPEEGISSTINAMAQDTTGFMYFATIDALYKYDGHTFKFFGHDPMDEKSIGQGDVNNIHAARDGKMWMTLRFGGLNRYDPITNAFHRYTLPLFTSKQSGRMEFGRLRGILWVVEIHSGSCTLKG